MFSLTDIQNLATNLLISFIIKKQYKTSFIIKKKLICFFSEYIWMLLLKEIKRRRIELGYKQKDMQARIGLSRQQYQQIESKGNPRLDTLELIAKGLNSELMLIPHEKKRQVLAILNEDKAVDSDIQSLIDNPWQGLLGDDES